MTIDCLRKEFLRYLSFDIRYAFSMTIKKGGGEEKKKRECDTIYRSFSLNGYGLNISRRYAYANFLFYTNIFPYSSSWILTSNCFINALHSRQIDRDSQRENSQSAAIPCVSTVWKSLDSIFLIIIHCIRRFKWSTRSSFSYCYQRRSSFIRITNRTLIYVKFHLLISRLFQRSIFSQYVIEQFWCTFLFVVSFFYCSHRWCTILINPI